MSEIVQAVCPGCKHELRVPVSLLASPVRCKHCQTIFQARHRAAAPTAPASAVDFLTRRPDYRLELIFTAAALAAITAGYYVLTRQVRADPGGALGHSLGIVGFLLMLSSETLYSLRKRVTRLAFGRTSTWLRVHIFTGFVGAYLVLLHSAGRFHGLAGVLTLLTVLMIGSGVVGRYLYTAVPRTLDGVEVAVRQLEHQITQANLQLHALQIAVPTAAEISLHPEPALPGWLLVVGRFYFLARQRLRLRRALRKVKILTNPQAAQLRALMVERYRLHLQINSLASARHLLALWHLFHVPLGVVLFTVALIHIGAALYYSSFLK